MNWILLLQIAYVVLLFIVILRVLYDTRSSTKALAYILFILFVPVLGMIFYFSFGINYRKRKLYSKKLVTNEKLRLRLNDEFKKKSLALLNLSNFPNQHYNLAQLLLQANNSPLSSNNNVRLLINGEEKFPELLESLDKAIHHIHMEYYIYEEDVTGTAIANKLIEKAQQGVVVRFMYDDFGSHSLSNDFINKLRKAGIFTVPFFKIKLYALANRLNYRNHRKIIIIDGVTSFIGGINISDKYRNDFIDKKTVYWRDTHLKITGETTAYLQHLFLCDWNFAHNDDLSYTTEYFPEIKEMAVNDGTMLQIAASGPDSAIPLIFYSLLNAIQSAQKIIRITSPYFIPGESLMDALIIAAQSGIKVQILVPKESDSNLVNSAARSYYTELIEHGVEIYLYNKGFIHAKTMVIDDTLAIIGSANMDYRSFDLNFEVNAVLYDKTINHQLAQAFLNDLKTADLINQQQWMERSKGIQLWEKMVRLLSPFL